MDLGFVMCQGRYSIHFYRGFLVEVSYKSLDTDKLTALH